MRLFQRADGRYYAILAPFPDLFGDPVVVTFHGNVHSRIGGQKTYFCDYGDGFRAIECLVKTRLAHGYREIHDENG